MLRPETIQAVQQAAIIEEIIGDFVTLKKKGQNLWACCPFHAEKTPSFAVSPGKGFYKCFGCEAAGDAIGFIKAIQGVSFVEAVKYIAQKYNIPVEEPVVELSEETIRLQHEKDSLYIIMKLAQDYYTSTLWQHPAGQQLGYPYLQQRGMDDALLHTFEIGYSLNNWGAFFDYAHQKGFSTTLLEQAGLVVQHQEKTYDRFRGRIMFPIHNLSGQVIAFAARSVEASESQPKYLNSPDTPIYHKGEVVYGLYKAKQSMRQTGHCFLVEGYTDVMALYKVGITNVVASAGTALTSTQIASIGRFAKRITVLFDGDSAGIQASLRGLDKILEKGLDVRAILLPSGEDPDSYAQKVGAEGVQSYLEEHEQDFITFKTKLLLREVGSDVIKRAGVIKQILQSIALVPDAVHRALLLHQSSQVLEVDENVLIQEHNKLQRELDTTRSLPKRKLATALHRTAQAGQVAPFNWSETIQAYEQESMRLLLNYGNILLEGGQPLSVYLLQELADVTFQHPVYSQMRTIYAERLAHGEHTDSHFFVHHPDEALQKAAIDLTISAYVLSEQWVEKYQINIPKEEDDLHMIIYKNILRLKLKLIHQLIEDNHKLLKSCINLEEEDKLLQIHSVLKGSEVEIAQQLGMVIIR